MDTAELQLDFMLTLPKRLWEALQSRHYAGLNLADFVIIPGETHDSATPQSVARTLRTLYRRRSISLPATTLARYAGVWKVPIPNGGTWTIRLVNDRLVLDEGVDNMPSGSELFAESETTFFTRIGDINMVFTLDPSTKLPTEMKLTLRGQTAILKRVSK